MYLYFFWLCGECQLAAFGLTYNTTTAGEPAAVCMTHIESDCKLTAVFLRSDRHQKNQGEYFNTCLRPVWSQAPSSLPPSIPPSPKLLHGASSGFSLHLGLMPKASQACSSQAAAALQPSLPIGTDLQGGVAGNSRGRGHKNLNAHKGPRRDSCHWHYRPPRLYTGMCQSKPC